MALATKPWFCGVGGPLLADSTWAEYNALDTTQHQITGGGNAQMLFGMVHDVVANSANALGIEALHSG